ncbi:MAG: RNA-binding protein [Thaumarchaeota archaeon]|nr:RNA-binding protein [Nitrososphaerota archaeon]
MSFEQLVRVSLDRVGVLVGKRGSIKGLIEEKCGVKLNVDGSSGEVYVKSVGDVKESDVFKAVTIVSAIARGFSPQRAFRLLDDNVILDVVDIRAYAGKSDKGLARVKGRIIGLNGKARRIVEQLSGAEISVYGHAVAVLGRLEEVKLASDAVVKLASGSSHGPVYRMLEKARRKAKAERLKLWEDTTLV